MNSPFVVEQAEALAAQAASATGDIDGQIAALYRRVLARQPDSEERSVCQGFLAAAKSDAPGEAKLAPLTQLAQLLLLTNEALYVD